MEAWAPRQPMHEEEEGLGCEDGAARDEGGTRRSLPLADGAAASAATEAAGRPLTRRMRTAERARQVVYVEHHHVHHHHHFHKPSDWAGPGAVPPEPERRTKEAQAEAGAEARGNHAATVGSGAGRRAPGAGTTTGRGVAGRPRRRPVAATGSLRGGSAAGRGPTAAHPHGLGLDEVNFSAEALVCRDTNWSHGNASGMTFSTTGPVSGLLARGDAAREKLPLDEYFTLVARLPGESRLKFSPYSVPQSAGAA